MSSRTQPRPSRVLPLRKLGEQESQHASWRRAPGTHAESNLFACAVFFDGHAQMGGAKQPSARLQVPTIAVALARRDRTLYSQRCFHGLESRFGSARVRVLGRCASSGRLKLKT